MSVLFALRDVPASDVAKCEWDVVFRVDLEEQPHALGAHSAVGVLDTLDLGEKNRKVRMATTISRRVRD